jgi:GT2 family glycosyltransferase
MQPNHKTSNKQETNEGLIRGQLPPAGWQSDFIPQMVSIVILTFNELQYTKKCVRSLQKHTPEPHEIIFVDNGSTDGTPKWLRGELKNNKNYKLIENRENLGFSRGCNQGMEASRGEYILLLNNDVVVAKGWLTGLIDCLKYAPEAGIVGPMTNNASGPQQIDDKNYTLERLDQCAQTFLEQYRHRRIPCRKIIGFCMAFKRSLTGEIGLLDETFGTGNLEDEDLCLRAEMAGYRNYIAGDVFIHHYGSRSFIGNKINYHRSMSANKKIFLEKWTLGGGTQEGKKLAVLKAMELADSFYSGGDIDKAVETMVDCIKYSPDEPLVYYELARYFLETKKFAEARDVITSMPEAAAESLKGLECAAYAHEGLNEDDKANELARRMLVLDENSAAAANLLGILAYKKQDRDTAGKYFERACADPGYGEAFLNMGVLHWSEQRHAEAWGYFKKGFRLSPSLPDAGTLYYSAARSLDLLDEAREDFAEGLRFYPQNKNLLFLYIDTLISGGRRAEAMRRIEDALVSFGPDEGLIRAARAVRDEIGPLQIEKPGRRGTVSLCMIVKNEGRYLAQCLKSVRDTVDEMIIVDTGSTDKTKDIAEIFGAKVFDFPWTGDFSAARNQSLAHATGEWVFIMDADEVISPRDHGEIRALARRKSKGPVAYSFSQRHYLNNPSIIGWRANEGEYPEETGAGWVTSSQVRLAPRRKDVFYANVVHELMDASLAAQKIPIYRAKTIVHHYGKLDTTKDIQKGEDYYLLGKIKYESNPHDVKNIYELAKQASVLGKHMEAVELLRKLLTKMEEKPESENHKNMLLLTRPGLTAEIYTILASTYLRLGRYDEARESAEKAIAVPDKDRSAIVIYSECEIIAGSLENAAKELEALLTQDTDYPPARMTGLILSVILEKKEEAKNFLAAFGRGNLSVIQFINTFAGHLHATGRGDAAMKLLAFFKENNIATEETIRLMEKIEAEVEAPA